MGDLFPIYVTKLAGSDTLEWQVSQEILVSDLISQIAVDLEVDTARYALILTSGTQLLNDKMHVHPFAGSTLTLQILELTVVRILVTGETSDGRSTLINNLVGHTLDVAEVGDNAAGTTKTLHAYHVDATWVPPGVQLVLYDMPGFGDFDVSFISVLEMVRAERQCNGAPFDGILLCAFAPSASLRFLPTLIAQMAMVAYEGVESERRFESVVFVGTHGDRCENSQKMSFVTDKLALLNASLNCNIASDHACVVDCQPLQDNTRSPGLEPLRKILQDLIRGIA